MIIQREHISKNSSICHIGRGTVFLKTILFLNGADSKYFVQRAEAGGRGKESRDSQHIQHHSEAARPQPKCQGNQDHAHHEPNNSIQATFIFCHNIISPIRNYECYTNLRTY